MTDDPQVTAPGAGSGMSEETRRRREMEQQRLAQALRDNLARRKAQSRARDGGTDH